MKQDARDALAAQFDSQRIVGRLHDVPPHEVYEVRVDGRRAVYKGDTGPTGSAATEGAVTAFVGEQTPVPVPEILHVGADHYVAAWHPDAPAPDEGGAADDPWARAAGRGLATLHEATEPVLGAYGQFRSRDVPAVAGPTDWHAAAVEYVRRRRAALARYGHADVVGAVLDYLRERPDAFAGAGPPVCCHGWATPDHVAVADGRVACVLDFEHALAAPGEFDYWRTVLPTFRGEDSALAAFREGYESVRSLPPGLQRRRPDYELLDEVYYLESLHVQDRHGPAETARRARRLRERIAERVGKL